MKGWLARIASLGRERAPGITQKQNLGPVGTRHQFGLGFILPRI